MCVFLLPLVQRERERERQQERDRERDLLEYERHGGSGGRMDLNVVVLWFEQALPFLLLLFCFFLKEHFLELLFFGLHGFVFLQVKGHSFSTLSSSYSHTRSHPFFSL